MRQFSDIDNLNKRIVAKKRHFDQSQLSFFFEQFFHIVFGFCILTNSFIFACRLNVSYFSCSCSILSHFLSQTFLAVHILPLNLFGSFIIVFSAFVIQCFSASISPNFFCYQFLSRFLCLCFILIYTRERLD